MKLKLRSPCDVRVTAVNVRVCRAFLNVVEMAHGSEACLGVIQLGMRPEGGAKYHGLESLP